MARLPVYLRSLLELADDKTTTISSERLAELAGVNAAKVRKDLSYLGSYGTRGVGYDVEYLLFQMSRELGLTQDWPVVIVGIGNLGQALANYGGFGDRGFPVAALVDADPAKVGTPPRRPRGPLTSTTCPRSPASSTSPSASSPPRRWPPRTWPTGWSPPGITAILNFAPAIISVPPEALAAQGRPGRRAADPELLPAAAGGRTAGRRAERPADRRSTPAMPVDGPLYPVNLVLAGEPLPRGRRRPGGRARRWPACSSAGRRVDVVAPEIVDAIAADDRVTCQPPPLPSRRPRRLPAGDRRHRRSGRSTAPSTATPRRRGCGSTAPTTRPTARVTLPSRVRRGPLLVTVSTEGRSPALATWLRRRFEAELGPEHEALLELVADGAGSHTLRGAFHRGP